MRRRQDVEPVAVRILKEQVQKIYAQPEEDRPYVANGVYDEMLFFLRTYGSIEENKDKLPAVYFSKEEQARIEGIPLERMLSELEIICDFNDRYYLMKKKGETKAA